MASLLYPNLTTREIIRMVSNELDSRQLAVISQLSPTECLELMFHLCEFLRQLAMSVERQDHPELGDDEIRSRVSKQILSSYG